MLLYLASISLGSPNSAEDAVNTGLELVDRLHRRLVPTLVLVSLALTKRKYPTIPSKNEMSVRLERLPTPVL